MGISFASALARRSDAVVRVVFVNQYLLAGRGHTMYSPGDAETLVARTVGELQANGVEATGTVRRASCFEVAAAVVDEAGAWSADAIVVGSHRRRWLRRLGGHGVREQITQLSHLPVLTAPAPLRVPGKLDVMASLPPEWTEPKKRHRAARPHVERRR